MKNHFPPRPFTYDDFIEELRGLIIAPRSFAASECNADSSVFKAWLRRIEDAFRKVQELGYQRPRSDVWNRTYRGRKSIDADGQHKFFDDVTDTCDELQIIVTNFEKHGAPPLKAEQNAIHPAPQQVVPTPGVEVPPAPLALPQQVTWEWAKKHIPISWIWYAVVGAVGLLGIGITIGKYLDSVDKALHAEHAVVQSASPAPVMSAQPSPKPASK